MKKLLLPVFVLFFILPSCTNKSTLPIPTVEEQIIIPTNSESTEQMNSYQIDTVITFNAETYEEKITNIITYQIDTIITFDTETNREEIQLVKTIISDKKF